MPGPHDRIDDEREETPYVTPLGKDERKIDYPTIYTEDEKEAMKKRGIYYISWNGWAFPTGPGFTLKWMDEIKGLINNSRSAVIIITGSPGDGKTYYGLRLAQIFDPKFNLEKQMCFTREHLMGILSNKIRVKKGQAVIVDESHFAMGSRSWNTQAQKDLIAQLATARSKGYLLIIVVLHLNMLDKIIRQFIGAYQLDMKRPGYGVPYILFTPRGQTKPWSKAYAPLKLKLPDAELCEFNDCLNCLELPSCDTLRARYERTKAVFLQGIADVSLSKMENHTAQDSRPPRNILMELVYEQRSKFRFNTHGNIDTTSIIDIVEEMGYPISPGYADTIKKSIQAKHPDIVPE